jgi:hypothetical protein
MRLSEEFSTCGSAPVVAAAPEPQALDAPMGVPIGRFATLDPVPPPITYTPPVGAVGLK